MPPHVPDREHSALLEAIGRALELDGPYTEHSSEEDSSEENLRVHGGAVDAASGRVAWIEERTRERRGDFVPVALTLVVAWEGLRRIKREVPTYNPYFSCSVQFMGWFGDSLVAIYREKHRMIAARLDVPYGDLELMAIDEPCAVDGNTVYFASDRPGLVEARMLPSLAPALPLPVESVSRRLEIWQHAPGVLAAFERPPRNEGEPYEAHEARIQAARATPQRIPLPSPEARPLVLAPERLWARLHELLAPTAPPKHAVDVLIGAVATPFWRDEASRAASYDQLGVRLNSPAYLPVYWHQRLKERRSAKEADAWLRWLDRVAALPSMELEPWTQAMPGEDRVARTALVHLKIRAGALADICRKGRLPDQAWCYFFTRSKPTQELAWNEAYPLGFRLMLQELTSYKPKSLSD